ncbi:hypothetical protein COO60DRAFT_1476146 [Scenedesmus sp. NREL 46B-D3]|nr:hypothetical protein COO60DRAFT_1476146 [Scenedesmus sp. NREL 46B-D3]
MASISCPASDARPPASRTASGALHECDTGTLPDAACHVSLRSMLFGFPDAAVQAYASFKCTRMVKLDCVWVVIYATGLASTLRSFMLVMLAHGSSTSQLLAASYRVLFVVISCHTSACIGCRLAAPGPGVSAPLAQCAADWQSVCCTGHPYSGLHVWRGLAGCQSGGYARLLLVPMAAGSVQACAGADLGDRWFVTVAVVPGTVCAGGWPLVWATTAAWGGSCAYCSAADRAALECCCEVGGRHAAQVCTPCGQQPAAALRRRRSAQMSRQLRHGVGRWPAAAADVPCEKHQIPRQIHWKYNMLTAKE